MIDPTAGNRGPPSTRRRASASARQMKERHDRRSSTSTVSLMAGPAGRRPAWRWPADIPRHIDPPLNVWLVASHVLQRLVPIDTANYPHVHGIHVPRERTTEQIHNNVRIGRPYCLACGGWQQTIKSVDVFKPKPIPEGIRRPPPTGSMTACAACGEPLLPAAAAGGFDVHPGCEPDQQPVGEKTDLRWRCIYCGTNGRAITTGYASMFTLMHWRLACPATATTYYRAKDVDCYVYRVARHRRNRQLFPDVFPEWTGEFRGGRRPLL